MVKASHCAASSCWPLSASGFYFPVTLLPGEQPETIVVRLDQSDLALLHKESAIIPAPAATGKPAAPVAATKK
jgi:hypothetical protein